MNYYDNDLYDIGPLIDPSLIYNDEDSNAKEIDITRGMKIIQNTPTEINPFKECNDKIMSQPDIKVEYEDMNFYEMDNVFDNVRNKLLNYNNLSDKDIYNCVLNNYKDILEDIFNNENPSLTEIFLNSRTLSIITRVFSDNNILLTHSERVYCNKLAYDLFTLPNTRNNDGKLKDLMIVFSKVINRDVLPSLLKLGLPEELSVLLYMARFSSQNDVISAKRVNVVITNQSEDIMTEQMIVNIYYTLFNRLTPLFEGIILDTWDANDLDTDGKREIYSTINLALLDIMEEFPKEELRLMLTNFALNRRSSNYQDIPLRFNIRSFSETDYPRLASTIKWIDQVDGTQYYI